MPRIFIPIESVTIAHVVRPLLIAKALRDRGIEVIFGASDKYRWLLEEEGFDVRSIYCADPEILLDAVRRIDFRKQVATLPAYFRSDITAIRTIGNIDAILADFRFTIRLAAEFMDIPHIALTNGYYTPFYDVLPELPQAIAGGLPSWIRQNETLRKAIKKIVPRLNAKPYQKLCKRYYLETKIDSGFDITVSKTLTLICDLPEFTPQKDLPDNYHFIGPLVWEPDNYTQPVPEEFDGLRRPLIYMTLGTSGEMNVLDHLINLFDGSPYDVIVSTGKKDYVKLSDNVYAVPLVKASEALKKASLMICHGGNGSIYQALSHAVPVLCLTTFYDQEWNGQRVRDLNLGEALYHSHIRKAPILKMVGRLIQDPEIKRNVKEFRAKIGQWNAPEMAAEKILEQLPVPSDNKIL